MKSPFPGMDPYIEACGLWGDFHDDLISEIKRALAQAAPPHYLVRTSEREYLELLGAEENGTYVFIPDVNVAVPKQRAKSRSKGGASAVVDADPKPIVMRALIDAEVREKFVEISEASPGHRLVTCIEVLSPTNKRPGTTGWNVYQRKRQSLLLGGVNLIEIDLLRGGRRMPMLDPWPKTPYTFMVARAFKEQACEVWPVHWRRPLPTIPVPLAKPDPDIPLSLQPMIEAIYQRSRYSASIDYGNPLSPPLSRADSAWLAKRLA